MKKWISKSIFHFSILIIELKNVKRKKKVFWIYFDLKPISKNKNQNFLIYFLIWNQKMNFKKFFHFSILVLKLENEKWKIFKIRFVFKSKIELYFWYTDCFSVLFFFFNPYTESIILFWFKNKTNFENFSFFIFHFYNQNWKMKEFLEIDFLIFNQKMNLKILSHVQSVHNPWPQSVTRKGYLFSI